eukprot:g2617.t1
MLDIRKLLPHHKKDAKFDMRNNFHEIVEICEMKSCRNCLFFECRKKKDLYLWASHTPNGPAVKFHVTNIHTMAELKFTGNCLLGSRPILVFDKAFDTVPQWKLIKELFTQMFAPPVDHPKSKPFVDHVVSFFIVDGRIWFRHYQIVTRTESDAVKAARALKKGKEGQFEETKSSLIEIGPRFVMDVVRVFDGSFGGKTLFQNPSFLAPNAMRHKEHKRKSKKYQDRLQSREKRRKHVNANPVPRDVLDTVFAPECQYEAAFVMDGTQLTSTACNVGGTYDESCRLNAAGGLHMLNITLYDLSSNVGSPAFAVNPMVSAFLNDAAQNTLPVQSQDQTNVALTSELTGVISSVSQYDWGTFDLSNTRAFNGNGWEDTYAENATDLVEGDTGVTATNNFATREDNDDDGEFVLQVNTTTLTLIKRDFQDSYPKLNVTTTVESTITVCQNNTDSDTRDTVNCAYEWVQQGNEDGCPTGANYASVTNMKKFVCEGTTTTKEIRSGFMFADNAQTAVSSGIEVVNVGGTVVPSSTLDSLVYFNARATDDATDGLESAKGYYYLKMKASDALGSSSDAMWSMQIADSPKFCTQGSDVTPCTGDSDCSVVGGTCISPLASGSSISTITSMAADENIVRSVNCLVEFDVVATGPQSSHAYAPTSINGINMPAGSTLTCDASAVGQTRTCRFSWTTSSADAGDHLVCFAPVVGTAESSQTKCQAIRIITDETFLKLTFPTIGSVQTCTSKRLLWLDSALTVDNTNDVGMYVCDASGSSCEVIQSSISNDLGSCTSDGLCNSFSWSVPNTLTVGSTYSLLLNSSRIACQADATQTFVASAKPTSVTILSPGGAGVCGASDWFKGCFAGGSATSEDENVVVFTTQETLNLTVSICLASDATNCQTLAAIQEYSAGTHVLAADLRPTSSLHSWIQADTQYTVKIAADCYDNAEATFTVLQRDSSYISASFGATDLYRCVDYTLTIGATEDLGSVAVSGDLLTTTMNIPATTTAAYEVPSGISAGAKSVTLNAVSYDDSCLPQKTLNLNVVDYPTNAIEISTPLQSATLLACEDITPSAAFATSLSGLNLGSISWVAKIGGSIYAQQSSNVSTVRPTPANVGQTMVFEFEPSTAQYQPCISTASVSLTVTANDKPLQFLNSVPDDFYPCTNVTIAWVSSYADFDNGIAVNVSLRDSQGLETRIATDTVETQVVWSVPSSFTSGSYTLMVETSAVPQGCMSSASKSVNVNSWTDNAITITQTPTSGVYRCNSFDFQWSAVTSATNLDVCICKNCSGPSIPTDRSVCYGLDEDTANQNFPLNTLPGSPTGTSRIYVAPADENIASCLATASASFDVLTTTVDVATPTNGDIWQPYCEYLIDWESEWALGPLRLSVCVNENCTDGMRLDVLTETTNRDHTFVVVPEDLAGWADPNADSVVVSVVVSASDYEGASIYEGCGYETVIQNITIMPKTTPTQTLCLDTTNSAYIPPTDNDNISWAMIIPICAGGLLLISGVLYYVYRKGRKEARSEENALELASVAKDKMKKMEKANDLATIDARGPVTTMKQMSASQDLSALDAQLKELQKKLRKAKIIQENLQRSTSFDDDIDRDDDKASGFAAELVNDI